MNPYDPTAEWTDEVDAPTDPADDSEVAAKARLSSLLDVSSSLGTFGSPSQQFAQASRDALRRSTEAKRKAGRDPEKALEAADPHGLIPDEDRRHMLERRGYDADEVLG